MISDLQGLTKRLDIARATIEHLKAQLTDHVTQAYCLKAAAEEMAEQFNTHRAVFAQALTRAAGLDQRLTFATRRLSSLAGTAESMKVKIHVSFFQHLCLVNWPCSILVLNPPHQLRSVHVRLMLQWSLIKQTYQGKLTQFTSFDRDLYPGTWLI